MNISDLLKKAYGVAINESPQRTKGLWNVDTVQMKIHPMMSEKYLKAAYARTKIQAKTMALSEYERSTSQHIEFWLDKDNERIIAGYISEQERHPDTFENTFFTVAQSNLTKEKIVKFGDVLQTGETFTIKTARGQGIAISMYLSLLYSGYVLMSGEVQYDGGAAIWKSLSDKHNKSIAIDVYHYTKDKIIEEDYKIGSFYVDDPELDKYWSTDSEFQKYLFIAYTRDGVNKAIWDAFEQSAKSNKKS